MITRESFRRITGIPVEEFLPDDVSPSEIRIALASANIEVAREWASRFRELETQDGLNKTIQQQFFFILGEDERWEPDEGADIYSVPKATQEEQNGHRLGVYIDGSFLPETIRFIVSYYEMVTVSKSGEVNIKQPQIILYITNLKIQGRIMTGLRQVVDWELTAKSTIGPNMSQLVNIAEALGIDPLIRNT